MSKMKPFSRRGPRVDTATVRLAQASTCVAVVADTHSVPHEDALRQLRALRPEAVLHAGDIGDLAVLDRLRQVAPVYAVRGNIDERADDLPDVLIIDLVDSAQATTRLLLTHIAVAGIRLRPDVAALARKHRTPLVVCGHSHVPFIGQDKGLTLFNPGSIGPRRFRLPILYGALELTPTQLSLRHYDCETGARWHPAS